MCVLDISMDILDILKIVRKLLKKCSRFVDRFNANAHLEMATPVRAVSLYGYMRSRDCAHGKQDIDAECESSW